MVGEMYVLTSRLIQTTSILSCTVSETIFTSKIMMLIDVYRILVTIDKTSLSIELHWETLQAVHCTGWNNCSQLKQPLSRMYALFLMSILRLYLGVKMSFKHNSVLKNLFLSARFCWNCRLDSCEMDQKCKFVGTIGYGDWYLDFIVCHF